MTHPPRKSTTLTSFDGSTRADAEVVRPDRDRHWAGIAGEDALIARGGGYSYAPASIADDALHVDMRDWRHVVDFDRVTGRITVEAGITLGDIHSVATPAGWHVPAQPGYPLITVGGCIAGDVHGKNQHRVGNFRQCVRSIDLWHPRYGVVRAEPGDELFDLTAGGFGLTGIIKNAELQLERLPSASVLVSPIPIEDAADTLRALEADAASLFSYTWQNFTRRRHTGRGVAWSARFADDPSPVSARDVRYASLDPARPGRHAPLLQRHTARLLNTLYGATLRRSTSEHAVDLFDFLFPAARKATYFKLFGSSGFHEAQILVDRSVAGDFLGEVADLTVSTRAPVTLASCKLFGGAPSNLRFDGEGVVLAVDAPRSTDGTGFIAEVHQVMLRYRGRPNLLKDSLISRDVAEASFPEIESFRDRLRAFDPDRRFRSVLSGRLGL